MTHARIAGLVVLLLGLGLVWFLPRREHWESHAGTTMGTTFQVRWAGRSRAGDQDRLRRAIDAVLEQVDARMSTYRADSEIRRFEAAEPGVWFPVSAETEAVVREALSVARASEGAFDPTIGPLVALWGFGPAGRREAPPDSAAIAAAAARTGWRSLETREQPPALRAGVAGVGLDLSGIAKGHAVDRVADALERDGVERYLVDIGGELRARGDGPRGDGWVVELEDPGAGVEGGDTRLRRSSGGVATSGTYRNSFQFRGRRYSHVLDPRTARPVQHGTLQVTTVARTCRTADARATALLVLEPESSLALAERLGWPARLVVSTPEGGIAIRTSSAFDRLLASPEEEAP